MNARFEQVPLKTVGGADYTNSVPTRKLCL